MEWSIFAQRIGLSKELIQEIYQVGLTEEEYRKICRVYEKDHQEFFRQGLKREDPPMHFLAVYCRMACDTFEKYRECQIEEQIFWDTFQDIRLWCDNYKKEYERCGLGSYDWFFRHIDMTLLRLGRLQFEEKNMPCTVGRGKDVLKAGLPIINIHIPQGEPLSWEACEKSLDMAFARYGKNRPYVCHSWLLDPALAKILPEKSRILKFQKHFRVLSVDYNEKDAQRRIFGNVDKSVCEYPEDTSLQRSAKQYLMSGGALGNGWGILSNKAE